jgi:glycosyltransferase involved in cell wall biosynthesis
MMDRLAAAFDWDAVVYDCMDDLASFARAPAGLREREILLLERSRLVFAGGRSLFERCRAYGPKVRLFASGVEFARFANVRTIAPHPLFANLGHPVCGYAGVIDERIDMSLVATLATGAVEVVLVGPVMKIDGGILPRRPNVHFTGQVPYDELPAQLAGFDVALMPFAHNAATACISPTKTLEYLAARKPVVSTRIADVVADYDGIVWFADGQTEFADACLAAAIPDPERARRGLELARAADWDTIAGRMWSDLERE